MLKSIQWDVYTLAIMGLVPFMLLTAGGLTWWEDYQLHQTQCELAMDWIDGNSEIAKQFSNAETIDRTTYWQRGFEELNSPAAAGQLRWGIIQSANYNREYFPDMSTTEAGVLNPADGLFSRDIEEGTEELIEHCPETEARLAEAFPMIFREGDPQ